MPSRVPTLTTSRLKLRGFEESDLDPLAEMNANPEFAKFLGNGKPLSRWESWNILMMLAGHWALRGYGMWLVENKKTREFVGRVGIWYPAGWPKVEISWGIAPAHWGNGYATEAAEVAMHWAFSNLELNELVSIIHPDNEASKKVARRLGERYKVTTKVNGRKSYIYSITREDFEVSYNNENRA